MRSRWSLISLATLLLNFTTAAPPADQKTLSATLSATSATSAAAAAPTPSDGSTIFNGKKVPPYKMLDAKNFANETKEGNW